MATSTKVLGASQHLTQSGYRLAVSETIISCQKALTDQDMADVWGVSSATVGTARNRNNDLSALPLLKLGRAFGPPALNSVLALIGAKAVSVETMTLSPGDVAAIPCNVASTLPTLIRLFSDDDASDADIRQLDREGVIDCFNRLADMLTQRRADLQLRAVRA